jgi:phosphatidylglycerol---prolipoprotein diacylglyceryl transferase
LKREGKLAALFLILVFGFRFAIEPLKLEQSQLLSSHSTLTMGQILSLPLLILGIFFLIFPRKKRG